MTFTEWLNEKKKEGGQSPKTATNGAVAPNAGTKASSFSEWIRKKKSAESAEGWMNASRDLLNEVQKHYSGWQNDDASYNTYQSRADDLLALADGWRNRYAGNAEAISRINAVATSLSDLKSYVSKNRDFYSQWDSAEAYEEAKKQAEEDQKRWGELSGGYDPAKDLQAGQAGWDDYVATQERIAQNRKQAAEDEKNKPWWEKALGYLGDVGSDTSLPLHVDQQEMTEGYRQQEANMRKPDDRWTEEQRYTFGYLWDTDRNKAEQYAYAVNNMLNTQQEQKQVQQIVDWSTASFGAGTAGTVGAIISAPFGMADLLGDMMQFNALGYIPEYDGTVTPFEYSQAVTSGIGQHLNTRYGTLDEDIPIIGGKGWGDAYGLGTSIAQSSLAAFSGGQGQALISFFGSASASGVDDALKRGASGEEALAYGGMVGLAEALAEMIGVDNLMKIGSSATVKQLVVNTLKQGAAEGIEEGITSVLNNFADNLIMGDKSNFNALVAEYRKKGMSEEQAKKKAWMGAAEDIAYDMLGGFVSGSAHAGPIAGMSYVNQQGKYAKAGRSIMGADGGLDALMNLANEMAGVSSGDMHSTLTEQIGKVGQKATARGVGRLYNTVQTANNQANAPANQADIAKSLMRKGISSETANDIAEAVVANYNGQELTKAQKKLLSTAKYNKDVRDAVSNIMYNSKSTMGQRNQNIRDFEMDIARKRFAKAYQTRQGEAGASEGAFASEAENSSESSYEVSADGKTVDADGNIVSINGISSIKNGRMILMTEDGNTIDAKDVSYGSQSEALVYEAVASLEGMIDTDTADKLAKHLLMLGNVNSQVYARGIVQAYTYGYYGYGREALAGKDTLSATLTKKQRNVAYGLAEQYRNAKTAADQAAVDSKKSEDAKNADKKGTVHFEGNRNSLTRRQKASLTAMEKMAELMGVQIYVFESKVGKDGKRIGENGWYNPKDSSIHIDLYAGANGEGTMLFTLAHELTHHIRKWSPAKFKILSDFLMEEYGKMGVSVDALVRMQIRKAKNSKTHSRNLTYDQAFEEVVADSMEMMLSDGSVMEKLAKLKQKDESLWQKIKDFISELAAKIRRVYEGMTPDSVEGRYVAEMKDAIGKLQEMFTEALADASENYQAAGKITTEDGGVVMSIREVVGESGKKYGKGVYLDSDKLTNLPEDQRKAAAIGLFRKLGGKKVIAYDQNGIAVEISIAEGSRRFKNSKGKSIPVNNHITSFLNNPVKQEALILADELIAASRLEGQEKAVHAHDWLDNNGKNQWDVWKVFIQEKNNSVWEATLKVANTVDGEKVLYEIHPIEMVEAARKPGTSTTNNKVAQPDTVVKTKSLTPGVEGTVVNQEGDPVAYSTEDGAVLLSMRTYEEDGREAFRDYLQKCVSSKKLTKAEMQEMLDGIEGIYQTCKEFKDKYAPFSAWSDAAVVRDTYGKPVFSVVTPNGDYKMNLDFSLVCKKRRTLDAVFNEMSKRGIIDDFELGQKSVVKINEIIRKYGLETACALCFVDAKRFRQASMADSFTRLYNELVESLVPEEQRSSIDHFNFAGYETIKKVGDGIHTWDKSKLDFSHIDHVLKTYGDGTVEYKAAKYIKTHAEGRKLLLRGDFMSSKGFDAVKTRNKDILRLYNSKKGTGGPKAAFGDVQYMNEIIRKARWWTPEKAYAVGGVRVQSFSDYVPRMVFDYVQMVYDLAATKLPAHAYTKEALFVKQFGLTGIKINMSLIPAIVEDGIAPGLDANGNYVWAGESFDYETAKEIQNAEGYTENCGTICVGVSYDHIVNLLRDPNIRMVIPYHKSGLNPIVAHMNKIAAFTDYTNDQRTKGKDGKALEKDFDFSKALHDMGENASPQAVADQYLKWCAAHGYTPRFAEFAMEDNYYKLLSDFTLYDKDGNYVPQREVRAVFPKGDAAFGSMKELIKAGLEEDAVIEGKRDKNLSAIVDEIQRTLPKTEAEVAEEQVEQADRDLEAVKLSDRDYGGIREALAKKGLDELSKRYGKRFPLSASFDATMRADNSDLIMETVRANSVQGKGSPFAVGRKAFIATYGTKTSVHIKQMGIDADLYADVANESISKAIGHANVQSTLDVIPHICEVLENSILMGVERIVHTEGKGTALYGYRLYNLYWYADGNVKTPHALVCTVVQDLNKSEGYVFQNIENVTIDRGLPGTKAGMSSSVNDDTYTVAQLYGAVKKIDRLDGGLKYTAEERDKYLFSYTERNDGVPYSDRDTESVSNRSLLANAFDGVAQNDIEKQKIQEYKGKIDRINAEERKLADLNRRIKELSFAKGPRDKEAIQKLRDEAQKAANRISIYDGQLLRLEASKPLQNVLAREKKKVYQKAEQKGKVALAEYRAQAEKKQREMVERYQESRKKAVAKVRETAGKRDARAKLQKLVLDTAKWLSHPTKTDVKCPDMLKQPYADFLNSIDMSSDRLAKGGDPTKNDLRLANAMGSLATTLERIMASQDPTQDTTAVLDTGYLDLPVSFVQKLRDMTEEVKAMMVDGDYVVNVMSAEEVRNLAQMIRTLNHAIRKVSTLYANLRFANVEELGDSTMSFMDALGEIQKTSGMKDFVQWENVLPFYAFKRFGKGGESIFEGLMDAQDKLAYLAQNIFDFQEKTWTGKEAKEWSEDTHTIDLPDGETLTMTTADAMSIYCLSRRKQGLQHLLGGGVRVVGIQKGTQKAKDSRSTLTIRDIDAIISTLNDRQKQVAEGLQAFMSTTCAEWGNEISMRRFLTREFTEQFYFPIESNDENLSTKDPTAQQSDLFRLLNISATKPVDPRANNEVIIRNVFDVFTNHASDMARLNAYGMALLDYMKWLNYRQKSVNDEGQISVRGVRKSMEKAYGNAAKGYVLNLIKDVNGRPSDNGDPTALMKWMRAAKTASVGSSLRVATLQITSYPRAALVLSPRSLALGLTKMPNIEKAKKHCGIALWKSFGFYDTNISRSIEDQMKGVKDVKQKLIELSLKGAEIGDAITWGALWNACEYEVAATKAYKVGSNEFYEAVGRKLREVVYRTQVVDSVLTRSQIMRSKRGMAQETAAFMSEPTLSANILMDAGFQFNAEKRRTGSVKKAWQGTSQYIGRAVAVYSIGQLTAALLEALWDAWRDDEDEEFGEKYISAFMQNLVLGLVPFNKIPIVSNVFEAALAMFDVGYFSSDKLSTIWLTQAVTAADTWKDALDDKSSVTVYNALYKTARAVSSLLGVSISGVMREGVALWNNTAGAYDVTLKVLSYGRSDAEMGSLLLDAILDGNDRQEDSLRAEFDNEKDCQSAIRTAIKERFQSGEIDYDTAIRYLVAYGGTDENDAFWKVEEWMYQQENGSSEDYAKYDEFYDAVESGKNLKKVIQEYTDHGVDKQTLAGRITDHFKPLYKEMSNYERASIKGYLLNAYALLGYNRDEKSKDIDKWLKD